MISKATIIKSAKPLIQNANEILRNVKHTCDNAKYASTNVALIETNLVVLEIGSVILVKHFNNLCSAFPRNVEEFVEVSITIDGPVQEIYLSVIQYFHFRSRSIPFNKRI